ncbi:MAG: GNAT family N-acetyltransferase [Gaiellaceae bacterium]
MTGFKRYLASLTGSWEALAAPHADAVVVRRASYVASRFPRHPVFNNAALLDPVAVAEVRQLFADVEGYAVWSGDSATAEALESAGMERDVTTRPMHCRLDALANAEVAQETVLQDVDPRRIAELNGVGADLLEGVPGLRAVTSERFEAGLVLIAVGVDVNVSFVATRPDARNRGLASAVTRAALVEARRRGFLTASLQATPMAERLYARLGFRPVGAWQEWVPPPVLEDPHR